MGDPINVVLGPHVTKPAKKQGCMYHLALISKVFVLMNTFLLLGYLLTVIDLKVLVIPIVIGELLVLALSDEIS